MSESKFDLNYPNLIAVPYAKTLDEKDIDDVSKKIISIVQETTGATLRS